MQTIYTFSGIKSSNFVKIIPLSGAFLIDLRRTRGLFLGKFSVRAVLHQPSKIRQGTLPDFFTAGQAVREQRRFDEPETGEACEGCPAVVKRRRKVEGGPNDWGMVCRTFITSIS